MYAVLEGSVTRCDSNVNCLSWMGHVPSDTPENGGWKLEKSDYYEQGWVASGNNENLIGITFTNAFCRQESKSTSRENFNLRGHKKPVKIVQWNEPYQKLASCDETGEIFVWIKYEGRWSIELVNNRNVQVRAFEWSHTGRMALICYFDGFVLVGSVTGQRYWSAELELASSEEISCGTWCPDDSKVLIATTINNVYVMSATGELLNQVSLFGSPPPPPSAGVSPPSAPSTSSTSPPHHVTQISWACEKFLMDEVSQNKAISGGSDSAIDPPPGGDVDPQAAILSQQQLDVDHQQQQQQQQQPEPLTKLALVIDSLIYLVDDIADTLPLTIDTHMKNIIIDWSHKGELLAVAGWRSSSHSTSNSSPQPQSQSTSSKSSSHSTTGSTCAAATAAAASTSSPSSSHEGVVVGP